MIPCDMQLDLAAYHSQPGYEWVVPGVGLICGPLVTGIMRNSIRNPSFYAALKWQPIKIGKWRIGVMGGGITGYGHGFEPLGAFVLSRDLTPTTTAHVTIIPHVEGKSPMVMQFSISFKLP